MARPNLSLIFPSHAGIPCLERLTGVRSEGLGRSIDRQIWLVRTGQGVFSGGKKEFITMGVGGSARAMG